jgi:hypothetical protein
MSGINPDFLSFVLNLGGSRRDQWKSLPAEERKQSWNRGEAMMKSAYVVAAALVAAVIVSLLSLAPQQVQASAPALGVKGDRVDARPLGSACSQREWPYFEAACLRDPKNPRGAPSAHRFNRSIAVSRHKSVGGRALGRRYCALIPARAMTSAHLRVSAAMNEASSAGVSILVSTSSF